jgi:alpha-tubulin suppressor-like RCC1 family protein
MTRARVRIPFLGLLACLAACASSTTVPTTEVLVVVNSDLKLGVELTSLQVSVQTEDGAQTVAAPFPIALTQGPDAGVGKFALPLSFAITKPNDGTPSFRVLVAGYGPLGLGGSETLVVEQKAIASFQDQRSLRLHVFLGSVCFQRTCGASGSADLVCYPTAMNATPAGTCGPVTTPALEPVEPTRELDGILPGAPEAAPVDAGVHVDASVDGGANERRDAASVPTDASSEESLEPEVIVPSKVVQVVAGGLLGIGYTCVLMENGRVACWGGGTLPVLGNGTSSGSSKPAMVRGLADAVQIAAGSNFTCARRRDATVVCWGARGENEGGHALTPVVIEGLSDVADIAIGYSHTCALRNDGTVACWGRNANGELGDGTVLDSLTPVPATDLRDAAQLAMTMLSSCARTTDGRVKCWGYRSGDRPDSLVPLEVAGAAEVSQLDMGMDAACACRSDGSVFCWGTNNRGVVGNSVVKNGFRTGPVVVTGVIDAVEAAVGWRTACARKKDGTVVCWGGASTNTLGEILSGPSVAPMTMPGLTDVVDIDAASEHACAVQSDGAVFCWGSNKYGELGDGTTTDSQRPVRVVGL